MKIKLQNLSIGYNSALVENINVTVSSNSIVAILGKNGSGKTTLLKTLLKTISPLKGDIFIGEKSLQDLSSNELSRIISIVYSQTHLSTNISVLEYIQHGRYPYNALMMKFSEEEEQLIQDVISVLQMEDIIHLKINQLSDGNFKKAGIARALIQDTPIIILDEPLAHLDIANQYMILEILEKLANEKNKSIIYTSHDWNQSLQIANKLWLIKGNELVLGFTEDIAYQEELIQYLSHPNYQFDFCLNQFSKKEILNKIPLELKIENASAEKLFWLYKALGKNEVEIVHSSDNQLLINSNEMILKIQSKEYICTHFEEILKILKS